MTAALYSRNFGVMTVQLQAIQKGVLAESGINSNSLSYVSAWPLGNWNSCLYHLECVSLHEHIPLPVFTCLRECTARRANFNKSVERWNLLSKRALFVPGILFTCPLRLSPATPHAQFLSLFLTLSQSLTCFFPLPSPVKFGRAVSSRHPFR